MSNKVALLGFAALTAFVFLATIPTGGQALQCYECNSISNETCKDPFDFGKATDLWLMPCEIKGKKEPFCRKQYQNIDGHVRVYRSCAYEWNEKKGDGECLQSNSETVRLLNCQCKDSKCNSGGHTVASVLTLLVPALLVFTQKQ